MSAIVGLPVTVQAEAAAWIAARHREGELDRIVEHVQATMPLGRRVEVALAVDPEDAAAEPLVMIRAFLPDSGSPDHATQHAWDDWILRSFGSSSEFPFLLTLAYEADDAG